MVISVYLYLYLLLFLSSNSTPPYISLFDPFSPFLISITLSLSFSYPLSVPLPLSFSLSLSLPLSLLFFSTTAGLPETAMNSLALGSCIGAVSESLQDSIQNYVATNPDNAVSEVMTER